MISIGRSLRWYNRYEEEIAFSVQNHFDFMQVWFKDGEIKIDNVAEPKEEFLMLCTGVRGIKLVYDGFFKEIMNPEYAPERMNDFLSQLLKRTVKVLTVLPTESVRLADETSLVMMDIVVELEDGSIANVEMQKIGYLFPGQRSACYSADLLLRQYKRMRDNRQKRLIEKSIADMIQMMRQLGIPEEDIKKKMQEQYQLDDEKMQKYL